MLSYTTLVWLVASGVLSATGDDDFSTFYEQFDVPKIKQCEQITGELSRCHNCYRCDAEEVKNRVIRNLTASKNCGVTYREGFPRKRRPSLKYVLPGQYPWRAWIYDTIQDFKPLCAATLIDRSSHALVTLASCLQGRDKDSIKIKFSRNQTASEDVEGIYFSGGLNKFDHENELAIITTRKLSSKWVREACLCPNPPQISSRCVMVSADDHQVIPNVPKQEHCLDDSSAPPAGMGCVITPKQEYEPELGGGLFCIDESTHRHTYSVNGVTIRRSHGNVVLVTELSHYMDWIDKKLKQLNNNRKKYKT
ncbi:unnamed protein product [Leptidea sinapis]|uniref:Peptidase S1 domain-containing protein n=1 Tax=Leptidea sinapis TaxID=189913 RepID=A0A5E4QH46_9NEOP|nr:unnamed protein product [Leptidea sinapis]VVC97146.1 unnamed protein product [Leptidea sinapis]